MNLFTNNSPQHVGVSDEALTALAAFVKQAINSSLSVDELKALGRERLEDFKARARPAAKEFEGYSLNKLIDEAGAGQQATSPLQAGAGGGEFAGYSLNSLMDETK